MDVLSQNFYPSIQVQPSYNTVFILHSKTYNSNPMDSNLHEDLSNLICIFPLFSNVPGKCHFIPFLKSSNNFSVICYPPRVLWSYIFVNKILFFKSYLNFVSCWFWSNEKTAFPHCRFKFKDQDALLKGDLGGFRMPPKD